MPRPLLSIANDSPVDPTATSSRALLTSIPTNTSVLATVRHLRSGHAPPCAMRARSCAAPATVRALTWFFGRGDPRLPSASQTLDPRPFGLPRPSSCLYSDTDGKIQGQVPEDFSWTQRRVMSSVTAMALSNLPYDPRVGRLSRMPPKASQKRDPDKSLDTCPSAGTMRPSISLAWVKRVGESRGISDSLIERWAPRVGLTSISLGSQLWWRSASRGLYYS